MQRLLTLILSAALVAVMASPSLAQADAQAAYQQAKAAFAAGEFTKARDLAMKAAETDPKNAEVFLLLGKAHYQLGELDDAINAWKKTLALAPEEPFAKRMIEVLQARRADVDTRIKVIEALMADNLFGPALQECKAVLGEKSLSDGQRAKVMTLQADALLQSGQPADAQKIVRELLVQYPKQADPVQTSLLLGLSRLRIGGEGTAEALEVLKKLVAEHPKTPAAATAGLELATYALKYTVDLPRVEALAQWLADNAKHPRANDARWQLIEAYKTLTVRGPKPASDAPLGPFDVQGLALTAAYCEGRIIEDYARNACEHWLKHFEAHYASAGAHAAAAAGTERLLAIPLPRSARLPVLKALGLYKCRVATDWLGDQARVGQLPGAVKDGTLPPALAEVVAVYQTIRSEYPTEPLWADQAALAAQVRTFAARAALPAEVRQLRGPDAWAIEIALPVVKANADPAAVKTAVDLFQGIIHDYAGLGQPSARPVPVVVSRLLVGAPLSPKSPAWAGVMASHAGLLDGYAKYLFDENIKAGNAEQNAKFSEVQKEFLDTLARLVAADAQQAAAVVKLAAEHIKPWVEYRHWALAEEVYTTLSKALPEAERLQADLAVVNLWIQQVFREHQHLAATGLTVPRELDPTLKKAIVRCYELEAGLELQSPQWQAVQRLWDSVVNHYKALEYDDAAEAAIRVKAEKAVPSADEYAAFQLIALQHEQAGRELARMLKQYGAADQVPLTAAFKAVIAAWTKFITDRPTSRLVPTATEHIFGVGRLYEQQGAFTVAAGIYADLAKFAAGVKVLSQSAPGTASVAERAAFTMAAAWDLQARKVLAKAMADRRSGDPPPAKLSDEFGAAIAAYKGFVEANPDSSLVGDAVIKVMAVAVEYTRIDAWDVADSIFADLLKSKLKIRRPERLEFARGLCQLGHAMPDHAREVLTALTATGLRSASEPADDTMLAGIAGEPGGAAAGRSAGARRAPAEMPKVEPPPAPGAGPGPGVMAGHDDKPAADALGTLTLNGSGGTTAALPSTPPAKPELPSAEAQRDTQLLAMIRRQEASRATQVAQLRENQPAMYQPQMGQQADQQGQQVKLPPRMPVLSEAELARQEKALGAAYDIFQGIRKNYAEAPTAEQARAEILVMVGHWRGLTEWQRSAALAVRFLADNPTDRQLPHIRLEIARDRLGWASKPIEKKLTKQALLTEVAARFSAARADLAKIVADFPKEKTLQQDAQWDIANSYLTEARVVSVLSPTLARGQYVRATRELQAVADKYPTHPRIASIPQTLWNIAQELDTRDFEEEAILVWNELRNHDPMLPLAQEAALRIAQTYHVKLKRPLKAAEAYQELNFARGGSDQSTQNAIFQIGSELKNEKRWVEALHVLETFVNSFPRHPQAGQALAMVGQIHQTNESWKDAIAAYRRVIAEYKEGQWVQDAKWSIAECTINLSQWSEAMAAYRDYVAAYAQDAKVAEANRRIEILKDLARYQGLVDEKGQRKAFDAQYQIAVIVRNQLSNSVKAIIEYRKVVTNWPESYVAAPALYEMGTAYLSLGETEKAREALQEVAQKYATSPLASDALFMVGKSYEEEADKLASVTREKSIEQAREQAQKLAYEQVNLNRRNQSELQASRVSSLKSAGKGKEADVQIAANAFNVGQFNDANVEVFAKKAVQDVETLTATQLADRQDKINAALRKAVAAYTSTSKIAGGNKADAALLQMATIYDQRLKDSKAAMETWLEIVRQFSGTAVAEDASWKLAQYYEREKKYTQAIDAYNSFLRNYRRSPNAGAAQFAVAECYEHLNQWVAAMDSYNNYITSFPDGPLVNKAKAQINWIKTYRL